MVGYHWKWCSVTYCSSFSVSNFLGLFGVKDSTAERERERPIRKKKAIHNTTSKKKNTSKKAKLLKTFHQSDQNLANLKPVP